MVDRESNKPPSQFQLRELFRRLLQDYECDVMNTTVTHDSQKFNLIEYCLKDINQNTFGVSIQSLELIVKHGRNLDFNQRMFKHGSFGVFKDNSLYQMLLHLVSNNYHPLVPVAKAMIEQHGDKIDYHKAVKYNGIKSYTAIKMFIEDYGGKIQE
jgi:hypothetical protein